MKFRWKITFCMICLLSLLFGIGGSALISISFQSSLNREEQSARESYQQVLGALQMADKLNSWIDEKSAADTISQLTPQETYSVIELSSDDGFFYTKGDFTADFMDLSDKTDDGHLAVAYLKDTDGVPFLQVSSSFQIGRKTLCLNLGYDLSELYATRALQQRVYYEIFALMLLLCAIMACGISWLLTRPMSSLSKASREIASGNLSYRSNIRSGDEIGALSKDFDAMAQKVEDSVQNLEDAAKRQEQFMGSFAHEMKTPMTSIIGYADLLRGQSLTAEEQIDAANYIFSEGKRLENLSFKLLDIFVADHRELVLKQVSPAGIVKNLMEHLRPIYQKSNIELSYECEEGTCMLEPDLTRMLLLNLLDNARKALDHGGHIGITSSMLPDGCRLIVADNGKGMPPEALQHLTEVFYRVDKSRSRAQGSAGLGLSLCAKIVERHHGTIHFDSKLGTGTTITVDLKGGRI